MVSQSWLRLRSSRLLLRAQPDAGVVMKYAPYLYKGNDVILETLRLGNGKRSWSATILSQTSWSSWDCPTEHDANSEPEAFKAAKQACEEHIDNEMGDFLI